MKAELNQLNAKHFIDDVELNTRLILIKNELFDENVHVVTKIPS